MATSSPSDTEFSVSYITSWGGDTVEKKDGELSISQQQGLTFSGHITKQIDIKALRWVSKQMYTGSPEEECLVVSYFDAESDAVANVFFQLKEEAVETAETCFTSMKYLLNVKYQGCTETLEKVNDVVKIVLDQPIFMGKVQMTVDSGEDGNFDEGSTGEQFEYLMLIDLECICLYRDDISKPAHQLMFWEEESVNSIERVKLTQKPSDGAFPEQKVYFQTKMLSFSYNAEAKTVQQIQNLIPKKKHLMTDQKLMLDIVPKLRYTPHIPAREAPRGRLHELPSSSLQGAVGGNYDSSSDATFIAERIQGAVGGNYDSSSDATFIAERIQGQLRTAEENLLASEDMQNMWIAIEFDIKEIIDNGTVPATDFRSGGMSADIGEHLEKALQDVEDQLRENNLPVAISRIQAYRELFGSSSVSAIRRIFDKNDVQLLQSLYFKSLIA